MEIISKMIEAHIFRENHNKMEFLLLKRSNEVLYPGLWQMVNGHVEPGEKGYQTALREIEEETGLKPEMLWAAPNVNSFYSHENDYIMLLPVFAAKVNSMADVKICHEHSDYAWVSREKAKKMLAWPGQRQSVDLIFNYFKNEKKFLNLVEINLQEL
jgi:dATP pyrophosphohydrolase